MRWDASSENNSSPFPFLHGSRGQWGQNGSQGGLQAPVAGGKRLLETDICTLSSVFMPGANLGPGRKASHWNLMIL